MYIYIIYYVICIGIHYWYSQWVRTRQGTGIVWTLPYVLSGGGYGRLCAVCSSRAAARRFATSSALRRLRVDKAEFSVLLVCGVNRVCTVHTCVHVTHTPQAGSIAREEKLWRSLCGTHTQRYLHGLTFAVKFYFLDFLNFLFIMF